MFETATYTAERAQTAPNRELGHGKNTAGLSARGGHREVFSPGS
jgi:hypothetical protein